LVVDDEPEVRQVLHEFLSSRGYDVSVAAGGADAVALVEAIRPDLILLDVAMPDMDGVETLRRIVEIQPGIPGIMVTANADIGVIWVRASGDAGVAWKPLALGAVDSVPNPFAPDYLDRAVSTRVPAAQDR